MSMNSLGRINFLLLPTISWIFPQNIVSNGEFMGQWALNGSVLCLVLKIHHQTVARNLYAVLPIFLSTLNDNGV